MTINSVDVNINIADSYIAQTNFNTVLILDEFAVDSADKLNTGIYFTEDGTALGTSQRVRIYASLAEVGVDFKTASVVYGKAEAAFAQRNVSQVMVGRKDPTDTDIATGLNAIAAENNNWYGLVSTFGALANASEADNIDDVDDIDTWATANNKMFASQSKDAAILTSGTTDIASVLKAKKSDRTMIIYSSDYDTATSKFNTHVDVAILALGLTFRPGITTLEDQQLNGVTTTTGLSTTQLNYIETKNCNIYIEDRGIGVYKGNILASGRFFDTRVYADYLKDQIETAIRLFKINKSAMGSKVSYTDIGVGELSSLLTILFEREIKLGALTPFVKYVNGKPKVFRHIISTIPVSEVPVNEKNARQYKYLDFEVRYTSAIQATTVNGTLLV